MSTPPRDEQTATMAGVGDRARESARGDAGLILVHAAGSGVIALVFRLSADSSVVGREVPPGGFVVDAPSVSRLHARISRDVNGHVITDLGSRNGVLVNGRLVRESRLVHGDIVRVGDALFRFVAEGATAYEDHHASLGGPPASAPPLGGAVGGLAIQKVLAEVTTIARTELSVVVHGETGTGKELVARAVHEASGRRGPFCALNCAAMPANLIESELFGHTRGAYTGADRDRLGYIRRAHEGTLMLDEIGDMPLDAQAKLLRVLESREIIPVGAERPVTVDVRFVCATHRDLHALVADGRFRGDLLARLDGCTIRIPPLRDRKEDLPLLVRHFWNETERGEPPVTFPFMVALAHHAWPYNVRELQAVIRRAVAMARGAPLDTPHLTDPIREALRGYGAAEAPPPTESVSAPPLARSKAPPREVFVAMLTHHQGNVAAVARDLGKDRAQVHRWLQQYGIQPDDFRT